MKCFINYYIFGLIVTTGILAALLFTSILNTKPLQSSIQCESLPKIYYSPLDSTESIEIIQNAIEKAKSRIIIAFSTITELTFNEIFFSPLQNTVVPKKDIKILFPESSSISSSLEKINLSYYYTLQTVRNQHSFAFLVCDDNGYFAPFITTRDSVDQLLAFSNCKTCADDIQSFIDFFVLYEQENLPIVIPFDLQAKTSAIMPVQLNHSEFFTFFNPDDIIFPLRITTIDVIEDMLSDEPEELYVFTQNLPILNSYTGFEATQFSLYLNIKALLLRNRTKIYFLARNQTVISDKNSVWCHSLSNFDNFNIKVYPEEYAGPNFIIVGNWTFLFTHPIKSHNINEYISLHVAVKDDEVLNKSKAFFESVWNFSGDCI